MSQELYAKLDNLIAQFSRFVETNHGSSEKEDQVVRSEWTTLKAMLEERPIKMNAVYSFFAKLEDRPSSKESGGLSVPRYHDKSPTPRSPREKIQINKPKLLEDIRRMLNVVRSNNGKLFKAG